MKYSESNPPIVCMQTQSTCYKGTRTMAVKGVLWHSTGANNPNLKRYVQPSDNDVQRAQLLKVIGTNISHNDWNHISKQAGLNAWIGKLADGSVAAVQTMPWNYRPWGCGSGKKGSCNTGWIQFEICEDGLDDKDYFNAIYKEAVELTAYLCKFHRLDPMGSATSGGVRVPTILCHQDSYRLGLGSNHGDVYHWFNRYGKTMDNVRQDVRACMDGKGVEDLTKSETLELLKQEVPGIVRAVLAENATQADKAPAPAWATKELQAAISSGITDGSRPQATCTRLEAILMAERARQKALLDKA